MCLGFPGRDMFSGDDEGMKEFASAYTLASPIMIGFPTLQIAGSVLFSLPRP